MRLAQCESQAIAQNHQGPLDLGVLAGLGTTTARGLNLSGSIGDTGLASASIIAPGRDGSQLSAPPPKLVSTQTANGGGEGQPLAA